jgi:hypothetical protein
MIFSGISPDGIKHIELIFKGWKTQTRRPAGRYEACRDYAVQPKRCAPADPRGRIRIHDIRFEKRGAFISLEDALAEGGYLPEQYEALYEKMYPNWTERWAYVFEVIQ